MLSFTFNLGFILFKSIYTYIYKHAQTHYCQGWISGSANLRFHRQIIDPLITSQKRGYFASWCELWGHCELSKWQVWQLSQNVKCKWWVWLDWLLGEKPIRIGPIGSDRMSLLHCIFFCFVLFCFVLFTDVIFINARCCIRQIQIWI